MKTKQLYLTPAFSLDAARAQLESLYGKTGSLQVLPGESDQNFRVDAADGSRYVLKIANAGEDASLLGCQNEAMTHVLRHLGADACPRVVPAKDGASIATAADPKGRCYPVRLLTYLPGKVLARARPHSAELLSSLGLLLGEVDRALGDFDHPAVDREFQWDLRRVEQVVVENMGRLPRDRRSRVARFVDGFRSRCKPHLDDLRTAVIHNDANDYNVIVGPRGRWGLRTSGLIDFGDIVRSYLVAEPAIAAAYAMLGKRDPVTAAAHVVAGYHGVLPLRPNELGMLFDLVCMRLCASACIAAKQTTEAPSNAYLSISQAPIWDLLQRLENVPPLLAHCRFRDACGLEPCPRSKTLVSWIRNRRESFAPVMDGGPNPLPPKILDLSVGSALAQVEFLRPELSQDSESPIGSLDSPHREMMIGRYDEARLVYSTPQFSVDSDELPEQRTVHLGIDLFNRPGTAIQAPLEGRIHSFADNDTAGDYGPTIILEHDTDGAAPFYTLYGHLSRESLSNLRIGTPVATGKRIGTIGQSSENGGWPPHLHFQLITDMLGRTGDFPGVAAPSWRRVWKSVCPDPGSLLGLPSDATAPAARGPAELMSARRRHLGKSLSVSYRRPLSITRGVAQFLYDHRGRAYLDCVNNVCHVGHSHPRVVRAGQKQMALLNTNTRYLHEGITAYAGHLLAKFPAPLDVAYFVCSGSEANELALRMARTYTGRHDTIVLDGAYHGNSQTMIDISPYKHNGRGGAGPPRWVHRADTPDPYRGEHRGAAPEVGKRYAAQVGDIAGRLVAEGRPVAAFIAESALGCGGQIILPDGYLEAAYEGVRATGGVCIADEIQVGFGRAGSNFWMFETQGVVPDIVTLGKPMGNGHPLAAVVTTRAIADAFANGMEYFNTFGGNPVSCAIGDAVLATIDDDNLQANAADVGRHFTAGLRELAGEHALIGDIRGRGLFLGVELITDRDSLAPAPEHATQVVERLRDHGILSSTDGPLANVLKFKPPMVFTRADADRVVATLAAILNEDRLRVG